MEAPSEWHFRMEAATIRSPFLSSGPWPLSWESGHWPALVVHDLLVVLGLLMQLHKRDDWKWKVLRNNTWNWHDANMTGIGKGQDIAGALEGSMKLTLGGARFQFKWKTFSCCFYLAFKLFFLIWRPWGLSSPSSHSCLASCTYQLLVACSLVMYSKLGPDEHRVQPPKATCYRITVGYFHY